jgi:hypothetical protein
VQPRLELDFTDSSKLLYASDLLYLVTVSLSRFAVLLLEHSLFGGKRKALASIWYGMCANFVLMVVSVIMIALGCDNRSPWLQYSNGCNSMVIQSSLQQPATMRHF